MNGIGGGLIAAPSDQPDAQPGGTEWGCNGTELGAYSEGVGLPFGLINTSIIQTGCPTPGIAAESCANLTLGGYSDWWLPTKDELNFMYLFIGQGNFIGLGNVGGFANNFYWSSTEVDNDNAWFQNFNNGNQDGNFYFKDADFHVRAVRAF